MRVQFLVYGQCYSLKNSKIIGHGRTIKHAKARQFEKDFAAQVPVSAKLALGSKKKPLYASITVWYPSYRQDADVEIVYDQLQKCGVVSNDRWIRKKLVTACVDPKNPRVHVLIEEIE